MTTEHRDMSRYRWVTIGDGDQLLYDRENGDAWIQSDYVVGIGHAPE